MPAGSERSESNWSSKKTSLRKTFFGQFHCSKAWSRIDASVYVHAGRCGVSMAVLLLLSEQHFLLTFLSFNMEEFFVWKIQLGNN